MKFFRVAPGGCYRRAERCQMGDEKLLVVTSGGCPKIFKCFKFLMPAPVSPDHSRSKNPKISILLVISKAKRANSGLLSLV